jgi:hypothetical protein
MNSNSLALRRAAREGLSPGARSSGTWRIDGDKLFAKGDEIWVAYPADKKSGDKFELDSPASPIPARLK